MQIWVVAPYTTDTYMAIDCMLGAHRGIHKNLPFDVVKSCFLFQWGNGRSTPRVKTPHATHQNKQVLPPERLHEFHIDYFFALGYVFTYTLLRT